jgi:hypothetical protein
MIMEVTVVAEEDLRVVVVVTNDVTHLRCPKLRRPQNLLSRRGQPPVSSSLFPVLYLSHPIMQLAQRIGLPLLRHRRPKAWVFTEPATFGLVVMVGVNLWLSAVTEAHCLAVVLVDSSSLSRTIPRTHVAEASKAMLGLLLGTSTVTGANRTTRVRISRRVLDNRAAASSLVTVPVHQ